MKKVLGKRAAAMRRARKMTQQQVADHAGRTWEAVSNFERGKSLPPLEILKLIAESMGMTLSELFEGVDEASTPRRAQREAKLRALIKLLPDAELDIVLRQVEGLTKR